MPLYWTEWTNPHQGKPLYTSIPVFFIGFSHHNARTKKFCENSSVALMPLVLLLFCVHDHLYQGVTCPSEQKNANGLGLGKP